MTFRSVLKRVAYFAPAIYARLFWEGARRDRLLAKWQTPHKRTIVERFFFEPVFDDWIRTEYLSERDPDRRESLKGICMGGESGEAWAEAYDSTPIDRTMKLHDLSFDEACPWYPAMDAILARADKGTLVIQIGASSGREMAYFARRAPELQFLGTDIDGRIIQRALCRYQIPNLEFAVCFAHQLAHLLPVTGEIVLYSNGSLQYVQPEHLTMMFDWIKRRGQTTLVLGEPWSQAGEPCRGDRRSRYRGSFSYSHDYEAFAEVAGLQIVTQARVQVAADPRSRHYLTRHYFLQAQAPSRSGL